MSIQHDSDSQSRLARVLDGSEAMGRIGKRLLHQSASCRAPNGLKCGQIEGQASWLPEDDHVLRGRVAVWKLDRSAHKEPTPARAAVFATMLVGILLVALFAYCSNPTGAFAEDPKVALPSIQKYVSLDGKAYSNMVTTTAGSKVKYRLLMTMPECVADLKMLDYTAYDKPNNRIDVDESTVKARIVDKRGNTLATLSPTSSKSAERLVIERGDLKAACPDLKLDDCVVVDYDATVQQSTPAGTYPNIAKLIYDLGEGPEQTVEVEAKVKIPDSEKPDRDDKKALPKTGDDLSAMGLAGAAIVSGSVLVLAYARLKRE